MKPYSESYKLSHRQFLSKNTLSDFFYERLVKKTYQANENYKNRMLGTSTMIETNSFSSSFATTLGNDLPRTFAKLGLFG